MNATLVRQLFSAMRLGLFPWQHRASMAPLTDSRFAQTGDVPGDLMLEYYGKRASEGGFLPFDRDGNIEYGPRLERCAGLYSEEQVADASSKSTDGNV
jgi:N-ethylmaleimide reductase